MGDKQVCGSGGSWRLTRKETDDTSMVSIHTIHTGRQGLLKIFLDGECGCECGRYYVSYNRSGVEKT